MVIIKKIEYSVIVDNIGTTYIGNIKTEAINNYNQYVDISKEGVGKAGNENVTLCIDGEPAREYLAIAKMEVTFGGDTGEDADSGFTLKEYYVDLASFYIEAISEEDAVQIIQNRIIDKSICEDLEIVGAGLQ